MKVCVIIPTYNEKGNMEKLIPQLLKVFSSIKDFDMNLLVVDDSSPDCTSDVVSSFSSKHDNIFLLKRAKKEGLGAAYLAGFAHAINVMNADVIVQMDADFSHNPEVLPTLVNYTKDYDFVIGSRYVKGGGTVNWSIIRKVTSRGGNFFARVVAGLKGVHDCTSGYRAMRSSLVKKFNTDHMNIFGYAFLTSLLHEAVRNKARIKETPIIFVDRVEGSSKIGVKDIVQFFINSFKLRFRGL